MGVSSLCWQESKYKQFNAARGGGMYTPIPNTSNDGGWGITQLTNAPPTYTQIWKWDDNADAGKTRFDPCVSAAPNHLAALVIGTEIILSDEHKAKEAWYHYQQGLGEAAEHYWVLKSAEGENPDELIPNPHSGHQNGIDHANLCWGNYNAKPWQNEP